VALLRLQHVDGTLGGHGGLDMPAALQEDLGHADVHGLRLGGVLHRRLEPLARPQLIHSFRQVLTRLRELCRVEGAVEAQLEPHIVRWTSAQLQPPLARARVSEGPGDLALLQVSGGDPVAQPAAQRYDRLLNAEHLRLIEQSMSLIPTAGSSRYSSRTTRDGALGIQPADQQVNAVRVAPLLVSAPC